MHDGTTSGRSLSARSPASATSSQVRSAVAAGAPNQDLSASHTSVSQEAVSSSSPLDELHRPSKRFQELSMFSLSLVGAGVGAAAGLLIKLFKTLLEVLNQLFWFDLPRALEQLGWEPSSPVGLCNYTWLLGGAFGATVGALSGQLLTEASVPTLGVWVREIHGRSGCPQAGLWMLGLGFLGLLTGLSGASLGPEPVVIILPSVLAGAFARARLGQPPPIVRAVALAGGAGGLSAFFGLPLASAFMVLEVPHIDGAEFAMEALPACIMASLTGSIFGDSIWHPDSLLGNSRYLFPGGNPEEGDANHPFGLGALAYAPAAGLLGGLLTHLLVICMKLLHHPLHWLKGHGAHARAPRRAAVLAMVGAANGVLAMLYPGAQWWGEEQLQVALTRGCAAVHNMTHAERCEPFQLPHWYPGLESTFALRATPGHPLSAPAMVGLAGVKLAMIAMCEAGGFVGGAIYPAVFMAGSLGSALGALPAIQSLGGQYVYLSTAAAMSVSLAALLNTNLFGVLLVVVSQANIPHGTISSQIIVLLAAVLVHYALARVLIIPRVHLIASQKARSDVRYLSPSHVELHASPGSASGSELSSASDSESSAQDPEDHGDP